MATVKKRQIKKSESVRERAEKSTSANTPRRLRQVKTAAVKPFKAAATIGNREYYLPLPDNKFGRFLNKKRHILPRYFVNSFNELKQVTWPGRKETLKLTLAVFLFAMFFGVTVTVTDYGLDKLFKTFILK